MSATDELTYTVSGMSCEHCKQAVTAEISELAGVREVAVDLSTGRVRVSGSDLDDAAIRVAVDEAGYQAAA